MANRELTLILEGINRTDSALRELQRQNTRTARAVEDIWEKTTRRNEREFRGFFSFVDRGFDSMRRGARRTADFIGRQFRGVARVARAAFSLPGLILGGAVAGGLGASFNQAFQAQRTEAVFRSTVTDPATRELLRAFATQSGTGLFRRQDALQAISLLSRELNADQIRTILGNRGFRGGVAGAGENLTFGAESLFRAAFLGEAELVERMGISLTEASIQATEAFRRVNEETGKSLQQMDRRTRAIVTLQAGLEQLQKFSTVEADLLQQSTGAWTRIKNTVLDIALDIGQRLNPVLESMLGSIERAGDNLKLLFSGEGLETNIGNLLKAVGDDIGAAFSRRIRGGIADVIDALSSIRLEGELFGRQVGIGLFGFGDSAARIRAGAARGGNVDQFFSDLRASQTAALASASAQPIPAFTSLTAGIQRGVSPNLNEAFLAQATAILQQRAEHRRRIERASFLSGGGFTATGQGLQREGVTGSVASLGQTANRASQDVISLANNVSSAFSQISGATDSMTAAVVASMAQMAAQVIAQVTAAQAASAAGASGSLATLGASFGIVGAVVGGGLALLTGLQANKRRPQQQYVVRSIG